MSTFWEKSLELVNTVGGNNLITPDSTMEGLSTLNLDNSVLSSGITQFTKLYFQNSSSFEDPYKPYWKDSVKNGKGILEVATDLLDVKAYKEGYNNFKHYELMKKYPAKIKEAMHIINFKKFVPITVRLLDLKQLSTKEGEAEKFLDSLMSNQRRTRDIAIWQKERDVIEASYRTGVLPATQIQGDIYTNDDDLLAFIEMLHTNYRRMSRVPTSDFNKSGLTVTAEPSDIITVINYKLEARIKVAMKAFAFNQEYLDFLGTVVYDEAYEDFEAIQMDSKGLIFASYDMADVMATQDYADNLARNYYLHFWATLGVSPFTSAMVYTKNVVNDSAVTAVNVTIKNDAGEAQNEAPTQQPGTTVTLETTVTGDSSNGVWYYVDQETVTDEPSQDSFSPNVTDGVIGTYMKDNVLHIGKREIVGNKIKVKAYAKKNTDISGEIEIEVK